MLIRIFAACSVWRLSPRVCRGAEVGSCGRIFWQVCGRRQDDRVPEKTSLFVNCDPGAALYYAGRVAKKISDVSGPGPWLRWLFRAPLWLYRMRLGWLLGKRFLLICHIGAKTGLVRRTVVEVIKKDLDCDHYWVASGYGAHAHWYKNLVAPPEVTIVVGARSLSVTACELGPEERADALVEYAANHAMPAKQLMGMLGYSVDGSDDDYRKVARDALRMFVFKPRTVPQLRS